MECRQKLERIKKLSQELLNFKEEVLYYKKTEKELRAIANEVDELRNKREAVDMASIKTQIEKLETEYEKVFREIDYANMRTSVCLSLADLDVIFKNLKDDDACLTKCADFLKTLIVSFTISNETRENFFGISQFEERGFIIIKINKDVERVLSLARTRTFYSKVEFEFKTLVKREIHDNVPSDTFFYSGEYNLYLICPRKSLDSVEFDDVSFEKNVEVLATGISKISPKVSNIIFYILKDNLKGRMVDDNYSVQRIEENNMMLKDTDAWVSNINEWVLDLVMKKMISMCDNEKNDEEEDFIENENSQEGKLLTREYSKVLSCFKLFKTVVSNRKAKASNVFGKAILKFFNKRSDKDLKDQFSKFSDLTHFIKYEDDFEFLEFLCNERESLLLKIIRTSSIIDIDLEKTSLMIKSQLKGKCVDFVENVDFFIDEKLRLVFIDQFFRKLYENLLSFCLKPKKHTEAEKQHLAGAIEYGLDLSYEYGFSNTKEYEKLESFVQIIKTSIQKISALYESGKVSLSKAELRTVIRMFFEQSALRDEFLDTIY